MNLLKFPPKILLIFLALFYLFPSHAAGKRINWEKINPLLKEATSVGVSKNEDDQTECLLCHEKYIKAFGKTKHARFFEKKYGKEIGVTCELCHGPMSKHLGEIEVKKDANLPEVPWSDPEPIL